MFNDHSSEKVSLFIIALLLVGIEQCIPRIPLFPWIKPGLTHAVTLVWVYRFGIADAILFHLLRQWIIMLFYGFSFFPFVLGGISGVVAICVSGLLMSSGFIGMIGIGILTALTHNLVQLLILFVLMSGQVAVQWQIPLMIFVSTITGTITGWGAWKLSNRAVENFTEKAFTPPHIYKYKKISLSPLLLVAILFLIPFFFHPLWIYPLLFVVSFLLTRVWKTVFFTPQNLITRYGFFLVALYITALLSYPGAVNRIAFWLEPLPQLIRLVYWLSLTPLLQRAGFFDVFYRVLSRIFKTKGETLSIGFIMPEIFPSVLQSLPKMLLRFRKRPQDIPTHLAQESKEILSNWFSP